MFNGRAADQGAASDRLTGPGPRGLAPGSSIPPAVPADSGSLVSAAIGGERQPQSIVEATEE